MIKTQVPFLNTREDAPFRFLGLPTLLRATAESTGGLFAIVESWDMPVGFGSPYHTHHREDESFYILEGEIAFVVDGKWFKAGAGNFVHGPREIAHGFQVTGGPARLMILCTPGGFEKFVQGQAVSIEEPPSPPDMARMMALAAERGIDIHSPLPPMPAGF